MLERRSFAARDDLAKALAEAVATDLQAAIAEKGRAALAVSGGTTPKKFFRQLGKRRDLDWDKVTVTLVDERWVPDTHERSNAMLVNETLLQGPAATAHFLPLYAGGDSPDATALAKTGAMLAELDPYFAAVVLGMGDDGHTASFFPHAEGLDEALASPGPVVAISAPAAGEPRVTLTLPRLLQTQSLYLHIEGAGKAEVLERALGDGPIEDMPVRAVLRADHVITSFWAP